MESKICRKCGEDKLLDQFGKAKDTKDKLRNWCKLCFKLYSKNYNNKNILKIKEYNKIYKSNNKSQIQEYNNKEEIKLLKKQYSKNYYNQNKDQKIEYQKKYKELNPQYMNNYMISRYNNDILFKLKSNIRTLIYLSFKSKKPTKSQSILGCSFEEFKLYLESKFEPWMNWNNRGLYNGGFNYGWDIDHIIPISSAQNEEEIIKLNHYTNLQPLCSKINREIKKNKLDYGK